MRRTIIGLLSVLILATLVLSACAPAAPTQAPAQPAEAPKAEEIKPTEAPKAEEVKPTEAPKVEEVKPTEAPKAEEAKPAEAGMLPAVDPMKVTGDIVTAGSSTVFPLAEAVVARFQDEGYAGKITIDSIGSGAGFERFCKTGETDVANASRKIKDEEVANCQALGREPIGFKVGVDALAVVVSKENTFVTGASKEELAKIFSDQAEKWSDVNPSWPAEPIQRFIPGTDSGTFDYFVEAIFDKKKETHLNAKNTQLSEDDNVLVQGVEGSPYAVGYFGYAYYVENADKLNVLAINGVSPEDKTVQDNTYPLSRPLFLYSDAKIMAEKPQVAAYISYFLSVVNDEIGAVGYFPLHPDDYKAAVDAFLKAAGTQGAAAEAKPAEAAAAGDLAAVDPMSVTGDIITAGSSTVFPLAEAVVARFQDEGYAGKITIDSIGSGAGFERFCKTGETDVANASRKIKDEEVANCQALGREPIGFKVGVDALAVVVSKENTFVTGASKEELAKIFSDQAEKWSDVNPSWPAEPILRFIPGTDSGTFDYFVEAVFDKKKETHLNAKNTQLSEDDNVLVQGVEGSPYAVGYFGYAYYVENADKLNVLAIDGVSPEDKTVQDNTYPLSRPLFLYSDAKIMAEKPQVASYISYFLSVVNDEIGAVGYFPLHPDDYKASVDAFNASVK